MFKKFKKPQDLVGHIFGAQPKVVKDNDKAYFFRVLSVDEFSKDNFRFSYDWPLREASDNKKVDDGSGGGGVTFTEFTGKYPHIHRACERCHVCIYTELQKMFTQE